jgi:hypothetical protein
MNFMHVQICFRKLMRIWGRTDILMEVISALYYRCKTRTKISGRNTIGTFEKHEYVKTRYQCEEDRPCRLVSAWPVK